MLFSPPRNTRLPLNSTVAIGDVDGPTVRMDVDAPGGLREIDAVGADRGALVVRGLRSQAVTLEAMHVQLVL